MVDRVGDLWLSLLPAAVIGVAALVSLALLGNIVLRYRRFGRLVVTFGALLGAGLFVGGATIVDELAVSILALAAFARHAVERERAPTAFRQRGSAHLESTHRTLYGLLIGYLLIQAVRGAAAAEVVSRLRWIVLFLTVIAVSFLYRTQILPRAKRPTMAAGLTIGITIYLLLYISWGAFAELFRGVSRFDIQPGEWGTPAFAMLPVALAFPAIVLARKEPKRRTRQIAALALVLTVLASFYYEARIGLFMLVIYGLLTWRSIGTRRMIPAMATAAAIFMVFLTVVWPAYRGFGFFIENTTGGIPNLLASGRNASGTDVDRIVHIRVVGEVLGNDPQALLFGYGLRTSGQVISDPLRALFLEVNNPVRASRVGDDPGTEQFTALAVETGLVGLGLFIATALVTSRRCWRLAKRDFRWVVAGAPLILVAWLPVISFLDIILLFLALSPDGFLVDLALESQGADKNNHVAPALLPSNGSVS